jgi:hypothetical protein
MKSRVAYGLTIKKLAFKVGIVNKKICENLAIIKGG